MISAVVLSTQKCAELLITVTQLKALKATLPFDMEIIVVDNASTDHTAGAMQQQHPDIPLIVKEHNENVGGWNDGFAVAKYPYFLLLDDDSCIADGLSEALQYLKQYPEVGILALNITSGPYLTDRWAWQGQTGWMHEQNITGYFSCGAIIRRQVYAEIGGIAGWLGPYAHEFDYGLRCLNAGYVIRYFQTSSVEHRAKGIYATVKHSIIHGTRNDLVLIYKYMGSGKHKYLFRSILNRMLSQLKQKNLEGLYYEMLGIKSFFEIRTQIQPLPVKKEVQQLFASHYNHLQPILRFFVKRLNFIKTALQ